MAVRNMLFPCGIPTLDNKGPSCDLVSRATPTSKESGSGQIPISVSCLTRQEILGVLIECLSGFNGCDVKTHVW